MLSVDYSTGNIAFLFKKKLDPESLKGLVDVFSIIFYLNLPLMNIPTPPAERGDGTNSNS